MLPEHKKTLNSLAQLQDLLDDCNKVLTTTMYFRFTTKTIILVREGCSHEETSLEAMEAFLCGMLNGIALHISSRLQQKHQ